MDNVELLKKIKKIEMPKEMRQRIVKRCYEKTEEKKMNTVKQFFRKPMVVAAAFALCFCLTGVTALAATGRLEGYFKDVKRWDGAVIGTTYEQATGEVEVKILEVTDELVVEVAMLQPETAPYCCFESFGINNYKIMDKNGTVVAKNEPLELSTITDSKVRIDISLNNIAAGEYTLVINELVGSKKADQPLVLSGTWECEFAR